jgi:hypothetical protein
MSARPLIPADLTDRYEFHEWRNAIAVRSGACSQEWQDVLTVLRGFRILRSEIGEIGVKGGAGGGCPVLAVGMKKPLFIDDSQAPAGAAGFAPIGRSNRNRRRAT